MFGRRILILVPHPDDEVVACAAAIGRARAAGAEIFALYLTNGCIAQETLWPWQRKHYEKYVAHRRVEGEKVAAYLSLTPVGWYPRPARHLWRDLPAIFKEIEQAIAVHQIDQLWVPAYEGGNADHDGLNAVSSPFRSQVSIIEFAEYNFFGGKARSHEFPYPNGGEEVMGLTLREMETKRLALGMYKSEQMNLGYVEAVQESYRLLASYDYSRPPHPGVLWYARFQWVPFKHPRIDFAKSQDVSAAIVSFLNQAAMVLPAPAVQSGPAAQRKA